MFYDEPQESLYQINLSTIFQDHLVHSENNNHQE